MNNQRPKKPVIEHTHPFCIILDRHFPFQFHTHYAGDKGNETLL